MVFTLLYAACMVGEPKVADYCYAKTVPIWFQTIDQCREYRESVLPALIAQQNFEEVTSGCLGITGVDYESGEETKSNGQRLAPVKIQDTSHSE